MGWTIGNWPTRKDIIADRTNINTWVTKTGVVVEATALKHCYRGNNHRGVLWVVWEYKYFQNNIYIKTQRWIGCDLLQYYKSNQSWGYKDMDESIHPFYYSCPISYLDMVPVANPQWRKNVRDYHVQINKKRQATRQRNHHARHSFIA